MSIEGGSRITQREVKPLKAMPIQPAFDETARQTRRGIEIVRVRETFDQSEPIKPRSISVEAVIQEKFGLSPLQLFPDLYDQGMNPPAISDLTGVSKSSVKNWLRKAGTKRLSRSQSQRLIWDNNNNEEKNKILARIHSPESNQKRRVSLQRFYSMHPGSAIDLRLKMSNMSKKENARRRTERLELIGKALEVRSKEELIIKLQSLYDKLGTFTGLATWLKQRNYPIAAPAVKEILKSLGIEIKPAEVIRRRGRIKEEDRQFFVEETNGSDNIPSRFTPSQAEIIPFRFPTDENSTPKSLRETARELGISYEAVRQREMRVIGRLKKLSAKKAKPPVD